MTAQVTIDEFSPYHIVERKKREANYKNQKPAYYNQWGEKGNRNIWSSFESYKKGELPLRIADPRTPQKIQDEVKEANDKALKKLLKEIRKNQQINNPQLSLN